MSIAIDSIEPEEVAGWVENFYEGARYAGPPSVEVEYICRIELGILSFLELAP